MNERWFVAVLVSSSHVDAGTDEQPWVHYQIRILRAIDADAAYEKALFLGRSEEKSFRNVYQQPVRRIFDGLHDLMEVDSDVIESGTKIYGWGQPDRAWEVLPKEKLTAFWIPDFLEMAAPAPGNEALQGEPSPPLEAGSRSNRQHTTHARNDFGLSPNILRDVLARVRRLS